MRYTLDTHPFMRLVPQAPHLGGPGMTGEVALPGQAAVACVCVGGEGGGQWSANLVSPTTLGGL